jgi:glycosyltransferase involved in cell wall biosynthesis
MNTFKKRISVILPVKNGEKHLIEALESVLDNINILDEIIIINDGSTDQSKKIISKMSKKNIDMTIIDGENLGPAEARNIGLKNAKGVYIAFIDHDDIWPSKRVERHFQILKKNPDLHVVVGKTQYFSNIIDALDNFNFKSLDKTIHHVHLGASTFKFDLFELIGNFKSELIFSEDHDLFLRMREQNISTYFDSEISLKYRIHETNMTKNKPLSELQLLNVLHQSILRRRKKSV